MVPFRDGVVVFAAAVGGVVCLAAAAVPAARGQAATTAPGAAVTTRPAAEATWLRVTAEEVYLRSRPDANSLPVARVPRDTLLRAVGRDPYGWYRIQAPEGVFSLVAAEYVDRRGPGAGIVSVRSGTLRVRVGSLVREVDPLQAEVQTLLERGAAVQIVGEQGPWLRIVPPPGVYVYVAAQHVEPVTDDDAAALRTSTPLTSQPTSQPAPVSGQPEPAGGPDLSGAWGQRLVAVEAAIKVEAGRPLAEQSWADAIAELRPIAAQREEPLAARLAEAWIAQLEQRSAEQDAVRTADGLLQRGAREQAQYERERQRLERARQAATRSSFAARGELQRSLALAAREGKRWYKLVDPLTGRTAAYVEVDAESPIDAEKLVGQYVGVRGPRRADPALGADVVGAEEIVALPPTGPATRAATQPTRQTR